MMAARSKGEARGHCNRHRLAGKRRTRTGSQPNERMSRPHVHPLSMKMSQWIDADVHQAFIAEQTDALRLCTAPDGWVERYGVDILISHKNEAALDRLKTEL